MTRLATSLLAALAISTAAVSLDAAEYVVRPGDTLSKIAQTQLGSSARWREIAEANNIAPPHRIRVGQRLVLPDAGRPVRRGPVEVRPVPGEPVPDAYPGAGLELPSGLWISIAVALVILWVFNSACLRIGCWFSLVETTFMRCAFLSLLSAAIWMLMLGVLAGGVYLVLNQHMSQSVLPIAAVILFIAYLVVSVLLTRRILACKWRSVFTVSVMSSVVANLLLVGLMAILLVTLPHIMAADSLQELFNAATSAQ